MDQRRLALLRAIGYYGSITAAAEATHRTPSAASQQIKTLEREVGARLVERSGRRIRLTEAGGVLAQASLRVAAAEAQCAAEWAAWRDHPLGEVTMTTFPSMAELLLPRLLDRVARHAGLRLTQLDRDVAQDEFAGLTREADLVLAHRVDGVDHRAPRGVVVLRLLSEPLDVALAANHPLADRDSVRAVEVIDEPWIGVPDGFPLDRLLAVVASQAGQPVRHAQRTVHFALTERLVSAGHGVALLPRYSTSSHSTPGMRLVPLADVRLQRHIEVLARPDKMARRAVQVVRDELVETVEGLGLSR